MAFNYAKYQTKTIENRKANEDLVAAPNTIIHPYFGVAHYRDDQKQTEDDLELDYADYVSRELGISKEVVRNNRILKGLGDPASYLDAKNKDLYDIGQALSIVYSSEYVKLIRTGYSIEEAKAKAMSFTKAIKEFKMKEHEDTFPTDLTRETMNKLKRKNEQGKFD